MLTIIFGFATSLVYGFADFFGALGSKRIQPVVVTFWSGLSGLGLLLVASLFMGADFSDSGIFWGITAGVASAFAMTCLYASLAIGPISILSPLGAVVSAIVPMIVGSLQGDRFSLWGWVALAGILAAVVLVGFVPGEDVRLPSTKGLLLGLAAGAGIGAVAGAVIGNAIERSATREDALEIIVQLRNGERRAIIQAKGSEKLEAGDAVIIVTTGSKVRVSRAPAVAPANGNAPLPAPVPGTRS